MPQKNDENIIIIIMTKLFADSNSGIHNKIRNVRLLVTKKSEGITKFIQKIL